MLNTPKIIGASCLVGIFACLCIFKSDCHADDFWNIPVYSIRDSEVKLSIYLNNSQAYATLANIGALSGEVHYDADVFFNPRIVPNYDGWSRRVSGMEIEPGVFRFTIYGKPISRIWSGAELAHIYFSFDSDAPYTEFNGGSPLTFSFANVVAAKYKDLPEHPTISTRDLLQAMDFESIQVENGLSDWSFYN